MEVDPVNDAPNLDESVNPTAISADAPISEEKAADSPEQKETTESSPESTPELTPAEQEAQTYKRRLERIAREKAQQEAEINYLRQQVPSNDSSLDTQKTEQLQAQARDILQAERLDAKCNDIAQAGHKAYADFNDKFKELNAELPLFDAQQRAQPIMQALIESDDAAALIHHLGSHPSIAAELADLSLTQQIRKLALIERDLSEAKKAKVSQAPKPITPVKGLASGSGPDPSKDPEGWVQYRNAQLTRGT